MRRAAALGLLVAVALTASGCAGTSVLPGHRRAATGCAAAPAQDGPAAPRPQLAVVCRWAAALQAGDIAGAADAFHLPSLFANGPTAAVVRTRAQAELVNESLSCGARVISAFRQGRSIDVLFRLTDRRGRGAGCGSGVGETARTRFVIRDGRIVEWIRAPSLPGDPGTGGGSGGGNSTGSTV